MYGSQTYGGNAYCSIDEARPEVLGVGASAQGSFPSGARVTPRTPFTPYRAPKQRSAVSSVEPALGSAILSPAEFANEWLFGGYRHAQHFVLRVTENYVHTQWPTIAEAEALMYLKKKVTITGTVDSPETFTTNIGKLATQETGEAYPVFSDVTHVYHVEVNGAPYQDRFIFLANTPTISGGNITFQLSASDASGTLGTIYCDIAIFLQAKP